MKIKILISGLLFLLNYNTFSQNRLTYSHSFDLTESDTRTIIHIDGVSDSKRIAALIYDRNTLKYSVIIFSKQDGKVQGCYEIENKPIDFSSVIITDSIACFLCRDNKVWIFRRILDKYFYENIIEVQDKNFIYNELLLSKNPQRIYLASTVCSHSLKDKGFLKVIEIDIAKKDTTINQYSTVYIKTDSLNFLSIYKPLWLVDISEGGTLGILNFEGNLALIKNGTTYKTTLFESDYTPAEKKEVLSIQKSYDINPTYEKLEEADEYAFKHKRSVGLLLSDSFFILTYQYYDTSVIKGIPITFISEVYKYNIDEETKSIVVVKLYEHTDNNNKQISKEPSSEIGLYIDLSGIYKEKKFLCGEYLFIYCADILYFLDNNKKENQTPFNFSFYRAGKNKLSKLMVFKIQ